MSKVARYKRWATENSRRGRRARFRIQEREPMLHTQEYSLSADVEELTDPPVYSNHYYSKPRWRDIWTPEAEETEEAEATQAS